MSVPTRTRLSQSDLDALKRLLSVGKIWVITMTRECCARYTRLARKGLVKWVQRKPDRRGNLLGADAKITDKGREALGFGPTEES